jgi:DNA-binding LacI/PurR family transcriptional regulator
MTNTEVVAAKQEYPRSRALRGLRDLIRQRYDIGDWLPTEQELCIRFNVSRGTLRTAMKLLESEGLLRAQAGRGRMVTSSVEAVGKTVMRDAVAVVSHESNSNGGPRHPGTDLFIQTSAIESIGRAGLHALLVRPDRAPSEVLRSLAADRPHGAVLLRRVLESNPQREALDELRSAGAAIVMYGDLPELCDFDSVVSDHDAGSYLLTKWLLGQGRRRILRFWQLSADTDYAQRPPEWLMNRDSGFERAMREANLEPMPAIVHQDPIARDNTEENFKTFTHLSAGQLMPYLSQPRSVDAIMVTCDGVLASTAAACRLFGITPQREVLLVGYDNFWPDDARRNFEPIIPAATVDKQNQVIGEQLVDLLLARAGGKLGESAEHRLVQPKLIVPDGSVD